jgi:hypothetical protein
VTLSGFLKGGNMAINLVAMFNEKLSGLAIVGSYGPCATVGLGCGD